VKLTRWYPDGPSGPPGYLIIPTSIGVLSDNGHWELASSQPAGWDWLDTQQLTGAEFPTRAAALRAHQAADALTPAPAAFTGERFVRVGAGCYRRGEITIQRPSRTHPWTVRIPEYSPRQTATLNAAAAAIDDIIFAAELADALKQLAATRKLMEGEA